MSRRRKTLDPELTNLTSPIDDPDGAFKVYKYQRVWKRAIFRARVQKAITWVGDEILQYGTSNAFLDANKNFKKNLDEIVWKKENKKEGFRSLTLEPDKRLRWYIMNPQGQFRKLWGLMISLLLIYTAVIMPVRVAFYETVFFDAWTILDLSVDGIFLFDFLINCFTSYERKDGELEPTFKGVISHYAKSWMAVDIISCLPFSMIDYDSTTASNQQSGRYNTLARLLRVPRLYKLLRIFRIAKALKNCGKSEFLEWLQDFFKLSSRIFKFLKFILSVSICVHIMGCIWFMSAVVDGFTPSCWVVRRGIIDASITIQYISSIYWAFTTVTTVGYGDITALTQLEMALAIIWMITGVGFYSYTIGSLSSFLSAIDTRESIINAKLAATYEFAKETGISAECKRKITAVVTYNAQKIGSIWSDKHSLFTELPKNLRYEVALSMYNGVANETPFFKNRDPAFVVFVMPYLKPLKLPDNEYLYREGEFANDVFVITKGRVNLVLANQVAYKSFAKGAYIGEVEILFKSHRLDNVKVGDNTEFLTISKKDFFEIIEEFPAVARELRKIAKEKAKRNRQTKTEAQAKLGLKSEVGYLNVFSVQDSTSRTLTEPEVEVQDDDEKYQKMLADVYSTSGCLNEMRNRMSRLEEKLDDLLSCFKGNSKPSSQTTLLAKLLKRKRMSGLPVPTAS